MCPDVELTGFSPRRCPHCSATLDAHAIPGGGAPEPGDWSICAYCEGLSVFGADGVLRRPTAEEWRSLGPEERDAITGALATIRSVNASLGRRPS